MYELIIQSKKVSSDNFTVLVLKGEIDNTNVLGFIQKFNDFLLNFNDSNLVLDLQYFEYCNSQFLGFMIDVSTRLSKLDKTFYVTNLQPQIYDSFDNMNLFQILKYEESLDTLIQGLI